MNSEGVSTRHQAELSLIRQLYIIQCLYVTRASSALLFYANIVSTSSPTRLNRGWTRLESGIVSGWRARGGFGVRAAGGFDLAAHGCGRSADAWDYGAGKMKNGEDGGGLFGLYVDMKAISGVLWAICGGFDIGGGVEAGRGTGCGSCDRIRRLSFVEGGRERGVAALPTVTDGARFAARSTPLQVRGRGRAAD